MRRGSAVSKNVNKYGLSRDDLKPDDALKIRQDCGFGCIICGCALFVYHHIDPEFQDAKVHDPEKMGLLCGTHHDAAHKHHLSPETVKKARLHPFCKKEGYTGHKFDIGSEKLLITLGGTKFINPKCVLRILGDELLTIRGPEEAGGRFRLTGTFYNRHGDLMFRIVDNEWRAPTENWDIDIEGPTTTIRLARRHIALVLRTDPPRGLHIERLDMYHRGIRVYADKRGVRIGPPEGLGRAFSGVILHPACCLEVIEKGEAVETAGFLIKDTAPGRPVAQYPGQPMEEWRPMPKLPKRDHRSLLVNNIYYGPHPAIRADFGPHTLLIGRGGGTEGRLAEVRF
jgi:hypothetical protein